MENSIQVWKEKITPQIKSIIDTTLQQHGLDLFLRLENKEPSFLAFYTAWLYEKCIDSDLSDNQLIELSNNLL